MKQIALLLLVSVVLFGACSSGAGSPDGSAGASGQAGKGGASGGGTSGGGTSGRAGASGAGGTTGSGGTGGTNATCASAGANAPCSAEGVVCGGESCTDICQFCNTLRCTSGRWQPQEAAPAPCFMCGPEARCQTSVQYCHVTTGGPAGSTPSYGCVAFPTACRSTPTCACLQAQGATGGATCAQSATGEVAVTLAAP